jgi:hypothetical protein
MNHRNKQLVVNFWGAPGTGKSTIATETFSSLKKKNITCEYVSEYAKDMIWEGCLDIFKDQLHIFSSQHHKQFVLQGKVDVILVDSPLPNSIIYDKNNNVLLHKLIMQYFNSYHNINFLTVKKFSTFEKIGRLHDEAQSKEIHTKIVNLLKIYSIPYKEIGVSDKMNTENSIIPVILNFLLN